MKAIKNGEFDDEDEDDGITAEQAEAIADLLKRHDAGSLGSLLERWATKKSDP